MSFFHVLSVDTSSTKGESDNIHVGCCVISSPDFCLHTLFVLVPALVSVYTYITHRICVDLILNSFFASTSGEPKTKTEYSQASHIVYTSQECQMYYS